VLPLGPRPGHPIPNESTRAFYKLCDLLLVPLDPIAVFQGTVASKLFEILFCERQALARLDGEARRIVEQSGGSGWCLRVTQGLWHRELSALQPLRLLNWQTWGGRAGISCREYSRPVIADRYLDLLSRVVIRR